MMHLRSIFEHELMKLLNLSEQPSCFAHLLEFSGNGLYRFY